MTSPRSGPLLVAVLLASLVAGVSAEDWPQILGPTRDGVYRGTTRLAASFPENGPPTVWTKKVGEGFAGPAVAAGRVFLFHRIGRDEIVEALDAETGTAPPPRTATTSGSTKGRARCRSSPAAVSTPTVRKGC